MVRKESQENLYNIGSAAVRWEDIFADQVYGRDLYVDEYIYHNGDANTYIQFSDTNDKIVLATNGSDALTLDAANAATFAGAVSTGGYLTLNSSDNIPRLVFNGSGDDFMFSNTANYFGLYNNTDSRWDIKVDGAGNTTFAGDVTIKNAAVAKLKAAPLGSTYGAGFNVMTVTGTSSAPYTSTIGFSNYSATDVLKLEGINATFEGLAHIKKGVTTDGIARFYNWRALENTGNSSNQYYRIARIHATQSTRFIIELAGRSTSYGDESLPAYGKLVGQLNNDDNYDLTYYNHSTSNSEVVTHIGQVDVSATETDIYIKVGQFAEITAIAHISDGSITTYDSDSGSTTKPTGYTDQTLAEVWNSLNDGPGSGLDADTLDGVSGEDFLRSDINDTASGSYTFTGEATFALDSSFANSQVKIAATTDQNPKIMFYRPTGSGTNSYPWRLQAGGGGSSSGFYIGTGASAQNTQETIANKLGLSSSGTLTVKGDVVAYGSPSDKNYKENIKPIENALDKVMDLEGVSFDWKESDSLLDIKEDIGFIAQDVQKVVPELVRENEDGNLSLRYQGLIPVLLEAMKEQQKQIDELKSQMAVCNKRACNCKK